MLIRELHVTERPAIAALLLGLEPDDRYTRFCAPLRDEQVADYVERLDFTRTRVHGAFDAHNQLVGVVELVIAGDCAELAFAVRSSHKGHGIGHDLMLRALERARLEGVRHVELTCMMDNHAMLHLAREAGMHPVRRDGESFAEADLAPAAPADHLKALVEESIASGTYAATALGMEWMKAARWWTLAAPAAPPAAAAARPPAS